MEVMQPSAVAMLASTANLRGASEVSIAFESLEPTLPKARWEYGAKIRVFWQVIEEETVKGALLLYQERSVHCSSRTSASWYLSRQ
jgi:hypothetical protein